MELMLPYRSRWLVFSWQELADDSEGGDLARA